MSAMAGADVSQARALDAASLARMMGSRQ